MDKGNYESYEYLPANETGSEQYLIVQDNGTFMIRQAVQFAPQEVKESLQTVYNVAPQQFLVDVENSSELISVSDQFIIPEAENNLYTDSYLLQPETDTQNEPMEQDHTEEIPTELKATDTHINLAVDPETSQQANSCTEITLTDEQYQILEQKGWILLEINDKIYVLDTLGLHDITENHKLIQKLRNESQSAVTQETDNGNPKLEDESSIINNNTSPEIAIQDSTQCIIENNIVIDNSPAMESSSCIDNKEEVMKLETPNIITSSEMNVDVQACEQQFDDNNTRILVIENENIRRVGNTLKVKTKLSLKNFPKKIVLGKTLNGKNLVAKVVQPSNDGNVNELLNTDPDKPEEASQSLSNNVPDLHINNKNILSESEFYHLLQHVFQNNITKCNAEDVVTADSIISQLLQIPAFKSSVIDSNLIITKTEQNVNDVTGKADIKKLSALVTGRVSLIGGQWRFINLPYMLHKLVSDTEEMLSKSKKGKANNKQDFDILHIQISEARQAVTDVVRVSVTVNKRNIPINLITSKVKPQPSTMFACSFCAALYDTELELKEHQTNECTKHEEMLTIDMDQLQNDYCIINTGRTKSYGCMICAAKFSRLTTCKKHMKTHASKNHNTNEKAQDGNDSTNGNGIYKCKMCPSTYFHPATLSKHILSRHISTKIKS